VSGGSRGPSPATSAPSLHRRGSSSPDPRREAREEELREGNSVAAAASELPSLGMEPRLTSPP
jgi:hypothetical protein